MYIEAKMRIPKPVIISLKHVLIALEEQKDKQLQTSFKCRETTKGTVCYPAELYFAHRSRQHNWC